MTITITWLHVAIGAAVILGFILYARSGRNSECHRQYVQAREREEKTYQEYKGVFKPECSCYWCGQRRISEKIDDTHKIFMEQDRRDTEYRLRQEEMREKMGKGARRTSGRIV